ncbi:MAG: metalloregulator ArsR/SmtB family transcription factor [Spirochaetes bacterium]|jgi:ArsR family transcriptional regulator|nr:metalloregulator ArsR/SmtB family transcription factor [Spirochaetota bacterium]
MKLINLFKAVSDETRFRLLNLLSRHELNVNEIVDLMGMGQSRISRHLKILTEGGLLKSRKDGLWVFYSAVDEGNGRRILDAILPIIGSEREMSDDLRRLEDFLKEGSRIKERFFDELAPDWDRVKGEITGGLDLAGEVVSRIRECGTAADLGCGTGHLLPCLKKKAGRVIGVDKSPRMLEEARARLSSNGSGIELRLGELEHLPMRDGESDLAVINMVLHHLETPSEAINEAARVIKSGDSLVIVELDKHGNEEMRKRFGHRWLGFTVNEVSRWLAGAGLKLKNTVSLDAKKEMKINLYFSEKRS